MSGILMSPYGVDAGGCDAMYGDVVFLALLNDLDFTLVSGRRFMRNEVRPPTETTGSGVHGFESINSSYTTFPEYSLIDSTIKKFGRSSLACNNGTVIPSVPVLLGGLINQYQATAIGGYPAYDYTALYECQGTETFTYEMFVNINGFQRKNRSGLLSWGAYDTGDATYAQWKISLGNAGTATEGSYPPNTPSVLADVRDRILFSFRGADVYPYPYPGITALRTFTSDPIVCNKDTWYHFALVKTAPGLFNVFWNGVKVMNQVVAPVYNLGVGSNRNLRVGNVERLNGSFVAETANNALRGNIDAIRITNDIRYTVDFTPPTVQFPTVVC